MRINLLIRVFCDPWKEEILEQYYTDIHKQNLNSAWQDISEQDYCEISFLS